MHFPVRYSHRTTRGSVALRESTRPLGNQLLRAGTSVGANYRAARRARSKAEFVAKLGIVEEECDETIYWIELLTALGHVNPTRTKTCATKPINCSRS